MRNTETSRNKYYFTKFCVVVPIPTENICFPHCNRWSKTSEIYEDNCLVKGLLNYDFCIFSSFDFSNCHLCLIKVKFTSSHSRPKLVSSLRACTQFKEMLSLVALVDHACTKGFHCKESALSLLSSGTGL